MERSVLKSNALSQLKGKWWLTIGVLLVAGMIGSVASGIVSAASEGLGVVISFIISGIVSFGVSTYALNVVRNNNPTFTDIFDGFKMEVVLKAIGLGIITTLAVVAGMMLLIVPGIIISLMFSQAFYIFVDNNHMSPIDCIKESAEMMKGHKGELFVLHLSFLGWGLLLAGGFIVIIAIGSMLIKIGSSIAIAIFVIGIIGLIIGCLFLGAYTTVTFSNYYEALKSQNSENDYSEF